LSGASLSAEIDLPEDLERVITANTRTLGKLRSASAVIDLSVQSRATADTMFSYRMRSSLWFDGRKTREDSIVTVEPGSPREVAMPGNPDITIIVPPDSRRLFAPEAIAHWSPDGPIKMVAILKGDPNTPFGRHSAALHRFAGCSARNNRLEDYTRRGAVLGYLPTVSEAQLDGDTCLLLEWDFGGDTEKVWLLPSMGYLIKKYQRFTTNGRLVYERTVELEDYGDGVLWFRSVEDRDWKFDGTLLKSISVKVEELRPNVAVDPALLMLPGMGIAPGTEVLDHFTQMRYRYRVSEDSGKAHLEPTRCGCAPAGSEEGGSEVDDGRHLKSLGISVKGGVCPP
jgi:hypothetical protein